MEEQTNEPEGQPQEPHGEPQPNTDYKELYEKTVEQSRKWEARAKANADKAKGYDEISARLASMEEELATARAENEAYRSEKERAELVSQVVRSTGVPETIVASLAGADESELERQAKAIVEQYRPGGAPQVPEAGVFAAAEEAAGTDWLREAIIGR